MLLRSRKMLDLPDAAEALAGRPEPIPTAERHFVSGRPLKGPYPEGSEKMIFALGLLKRPALSSRRMTQARVRGCLM